jgi:hypothetical protein
MIEPKRPRLAVSVATRMSTNSSYGTVPIAPSSNSSKSSLT